jgi:BON domain
MRHKLVLSVAMLAMSFAAGCAKKNDAALVTNIQSQMFADPLLKDSSIKVTAANGEVTLSGTVTNDAAHLDAYKIASQVAGVVKVNDQIAVVSAQTAPAQVAQNSAPPEASTPPAATPSEPAPAPASSKRHRHHPKSQDQAANDSQNNQDQYAQNNSAQGNPPPDNSAANGAQSAAPPLPQEAPPAQPAPAPLPPPPPPAPQPTQVDVPAGTTLTIRMIDGIDSSVNQAGEIFHASLENPVVVDNQVIVPKGVDVYVRLVNASQAGRISGKSELSLQLVKMEFQGRSYPLVSGTYEQSGASRGKNTAEKVGGGAVLGALIGAIAGGGKGAAIGAGVGGAGGGVYQAATHGKKVKIPSETKLDFQLDQPVSVTVMPRSNPSGANAQ